MSVRNLIMAAAGQVGPPDAPKIGTAAAVSSTSATVSFTAPSNNGSPITSYTATSSPGGVTATLVQSGSGTITITGLNSSTAYTFTVKATNAKGTGLASAASNSISTPAAAWSQIRAASQPYSLDGSSNGQFLIYIDMGDTATRGLYRSADYGSTWTKIYNAYSAPLTVGATWNSTGAFKPNRSCLISDNGQIIVSYAQINTTAYRVLQSTDGGTTWAVSNPSVAGNLGWQPWYNMTATPTCSVIYALGALKLARSFDYGITWNAVTQPFATNANYMSCSDSGETIALSLNTSLRISFDYGVTWTAAQTVGTLVTVSGNGAVMVVWSGSMCKVSTNSGTTWVNRTAIASSYGNIVNMRLSYTGTTIVITTLGVPGGTGTVLRSTDSGVTWTDLYSPGNYWIGLTINSNGTQIATGAYPDATYGSTPSTLWIYR